MPHTYSTETIYHFTCANCKNWWSYATSSGQVPNSMYCPLCGHIDNIQNHQDPGHITQHAVRLDLQHTISGDC